MRRLHETAYILTATDLQKSEVVRLLRGKKMAIAMGAADLIAVWPKKGCVDGFGKEILRS